MPPFVDPSHSLASSFSSSIGLGLPPRRPAIHPQISRLRSSQGGASHQRFPSISSYTTAHTRPGARPFSPSSSQFDVLSRRSSASNVLDGPSPALSVLFSSPPSSVVNAGQQTSPIKWQPLKRLSARMLSPKLPLPSLAQPTTPSALGRPSAIAASGVICIGTDAGWTLVFDYSQVLRCICGTESIGALPALLSRTNETRAQPTKPAPSLRSPSPKITPSSPSGTARAASTSTLSPLRINLHAPFRPSHLTSFSPVEQKVTSPVPPFDISASSALVIPPSSPRTIEVSLSLIR